MLRHFRKTIDLLREVKPTADTRALEADALGQTLLMGPRVGELEDGDQLVARALQLARESNDPLVRARLRYGIASWELFTGDLEGASAHFPEAIALADTLGSAELRIAARYTCALGEMFRGSLATSVAELEAARDISAEHPGICANVLGYDTRGPSLDFSAC
jgi:hypothetical protein